MGRRIGLTIARSIGDGNGKKQVSWTPLSSRVLNSKIEMPEEKGVNHKLRVDEMHQGNHRNQAKPSLGWSEKEGRV